MFKGHIIFIIANFFVLMPMHGYANSPAELVNKGNSAYQAGKYDEALAAYDEASVEAPESPQIYFNKGTALYQKGDYNKAAEAFEKAALKSKEISLEAKSKFNLGNCAYREAQRQQDSDLNKALDECSQSIRHYQEALELDPEFKEAAENIEVVRLVMKNILDEINKQKKAAEQKQEAMQRAADKLKQLIEKQQKALDRNQELGDERSRNGDSPGLLEKIKDLAQDQKGLQEETEELAENMPKSNNQKTTATENPAEKHLRNAVKEQRAASGNLEQFNTSAAQTNQEKALEELKDALASLRGEQEAGGQRQEQQQEGEQQEQQQQTQSTDKPPQDKEDKEKNGTAMAQLSDDAEDILDEEKENKKQRRLQTSGGYRAVDKDW
jgi:Ca-activated chloride channel family protein